MAIPDDPVEEHDRPLYAIHGDVDDVA